MIDWEIIYDLSACVDALERCDTKGVEHRLALLKSRIARIAEIEMLTRLEHPRPRLLDVFQHNRKGMSQQEAGRLGGRAAQEKRKRA